MSSKYHDLTGFQRDILAAIARIERRDETPYGLGIKNELDPHYTEVHHGRIYPNLDTLEEMGAIEKSKLDDRTNQYTLTERGRGMLVDHTQSVADSLGYELQESDRAIADGGER